MFPEAHPSYPLPAEVRVDEFHPIIGRDSRGAVLFGEHEAAVMLNDKRRVFLLEVFDKKARVAPSGTCSIIPLTMMCMVSFTGSSFLMASAQEALRILFDRGAPESHFHAAEFQQLPRKPRRKTQQGS